jgi:hypothetical protein
MQKKMAAYLLLLSFGLMLCAFFAKVHEMSFLAFIMIICSLALTFRSESLQRNSGTELLEMAVSVVGTNGFFILALLIGIGADKASILIASFGGFALYYWSYIRIFPKEMRRSILSKR